MLKRSLISFVAVGFLVLGCGSESSKKPGEDPVKPPNGNHVVTLRLFGAPWCTNCKTDFPKINEQLSADLAGGKVGGELLVTTGTTAGQPATQEVAEAYRKALGLNVTAKPDPSWATFKAQVQEDRKLPAAVVMDKDGKVLRVFAPGPTFSPELVVAFVKDAIK